MTKRVQTPTPPNEWCYQDQGENFRYFTKRVLLGKNEQPWAECTDADKAAYEAEQAALRSATEANVEPNCDMPAEALRDTDSEEGSV